jgi:hypothetical protein
MLTRSLVLALDLSVSGRMLVSRASLAAGYPAANHACIRCLQLCRSHHRLVCVRTHDMLLSSSCCDDSGWTLVHNKTFFGYSSHHWPMVFMARHSCLLPVCPLLRRMIHKHGRWV